MLEELASDFNLGLITNGPSVAQWEKINESGCHKFFDTVIVSGDLDVEKPNKCIYELACSELKVNPSECIMVGDKIETDIKGGMNAGVGATVWVNARNKSAPDDIQPDFTIVNVTKLPDILPTITAASQNEES